MKYKVFHYHSKTIGLASEEIPISDTDPRWCTEYTIDAETPFEAAVLAHGIYSGYSADQLVANPSSPARTIRERLEDTITPSLIGDNSDKQSVFHYDNISGHWIVVVPV